MNKDFHLETLPVQMMQEKILRLYLLKTALQKYLFLFEEEFYTHSLKCSFALQNRCERIQNEAWIDLNSGYILPCAQSRTLQLNDFQAETEFLSEDLKDLFLQS